LEKGDLEIRKLWKAIKDINRVFQKLKKKGELIDLKNKEDLKLIQKLYETDLNIQLGTIDKDINKEDLTKLCKKWAKIQKIIDRKVIIDRVIIEEAEDDESLKLIHEEEKVLNMVRSYFENQFRKWNFRENKMLSNQKERYAPLRDIKKDWYDEILKEIQLEEWNTAMQQVSQ
ncbi:40759_t:CDS:2, partial [Gigaspora margarita]